MRSHFLIWGIFCRRCRNLQHSKKRLARYIARFPFNFCREWFCDDDKKNCFDHLVWDSHAGHLRFSIVLGKNSPKADAQRLKIKERGSHKKQRFNERLKHLIFMLKVAWEDRRAWKYLKRWIAFFTLPFSHIIYLDSSNIALYRVFHTCLSIILLTFFWHFSLARKRTYLLLNVRYKRCFFQPWWRLFLCLHSRELASSAWCSSL